MVRLQEPMGVVTPTVDGPVLRVLAGADRSFTTTELGHLTQRSGNGVRLVLNRLAVEGLVEVHRVGSQFTYRLNRDHLAADAVVALAQLKSTLLCRLTEELSEWSMPPVFAALFGSAARGDMTRDSDIDVFVASSGSLDDDADTDVERLERNVRRWTGNECRVLLLPAAVVESNEDDPALTRIAREGVPLVGDPRWLLRRVGSSSRRRSSRAG